MNKNNFIPFIYKLILLRNILIYIFIYLIKKKLFKVILINFLILLWFPHKSESHIISKQDSTTDNNKLNNSNIVIKIVFNTVPKKANSSFTNLKFDKEFALNLEWDDNSIGSIDGLAILNGGLASNGIVYPGKTFTDGCENDLYYKAALGINGYNRFNGKEWGQNHPQKVSYTQMKILIDHGWDIQNHSLKHIVLNTIDSAKSDLKELNQLIKDKIDYNINTLVVPSNYNNYMKAAKDLGFIAGTTQADNNKDGIKMYPTNAWIENIDIAEIPDGFTSLNRAFNDNWSETQILKMKLLKTKNTSSKTVNRLIRIGSHNINDIEGFANFVDYIEKVSEDKIWVTNMRELFEYRIVKNNTTKSEKLSGDTLIITLNQDKVDDKIRWRDITLKINSEASISSISFIGVEKKSINLKKGLINIFNEKRYSKI